MINLLMRLAGYINIKKVRIPFYYKEPKNGKMEDKRKFCRYYRILPEIILDRNNFLIDGYCSYLIARRLDIKYVKFRKSKKQLMKINKK